MEALRLCRSRLKLLGVHLIVWLGNGPKYTRYPASGFTEADLSSLSKSLNTLTGVHREHKDAPPGSRASLHRPLNSPCLSPGILSQERWNESPRRPFLTALWPPSASYPVIHSAAFCVITSPRRIPPPSSTMSWKKMELGAS